MHDLMTRRRAAAVLLAAAVAWTPAAAQVTVVTPTLEEREARPGESYEGTIRVRNGGATLQRVRVYQTDYRPFADGRARFDAAGTQPRSSAPWVQVAPAVLALAPGEEAAVRYEVRVPRGGGLSGTYWSVVMVEGEPASPTASGRGVSLTPVVRYAVQLATHLADGDADLTFGAPRLAAGGAGTRLALEVGNAGSRAGRVALRLDLFELDGTPAGSFESRRGLLYPGSSLEQVFELGRLAPGAYRALLIADTGDAEVFGAEYTLRI